MTQAGSLSQGPRLSDRSVYCLVFRFLDLSDTPNLAVEFRRAESFGVDVAGTADGQLCGVCLAGDGRVAGAVEADDKLFAVDSPDGRIACPVDDEGRFGSLEAVDVDVACAVDDEVDIRTGDALRGTEVDGAVELGFLEDLAAELDLQVLEVAESGPVTLDDQQAVLVRDGDVTEDIVRSDDGQEAVARRVGHVDRQVAPQGGEFAGDVVARHPVAAGRDGFAVGVRVDVEVDVLFELLFEFVADADEAAGGEDEQRCGCQEGEYLFHVCFVLVDEFFQVDAEQGGAVADEGDLLVDELATFRLADHVDGVARDEEADAALVEDDLAVRQELVGAGHGVGVDSDRGAPFPHRGDAATWLELPGEDPFAEIVRDLDVDGFVGVEFHGFLVFEGAEAVPDAPEQAADDDGVNDVDGPVQEAEDPVGGFEEGFQLLRVDVAGAEDEHHQHREHDTEAEQTEQRLGDLRPLEADGAEGEDQDAFAPVAEQDGGQVETDSFFIHDFCQYVVGEGLVEETAAVGKREDQGHQCVGDEQQREQDGGQDDADHQGHGEPFLGGGGRQHQEVGAGALLGHEAVELDTGAEDDHAQDGEEGHELHGIGHQVRAPSADQADELVDDIEDDGDQAHEQQAEPVVVPGTAQVVQEILAEALDIKNVIHG